MPEAAKAFMESLDIQHLLQMSCVADFFRTMIYMFCDIFGMEGDDHFSTFLILHSISHTQVHLLVHSGFVFWYTRRRSVQIDGVVGHVPVSRL
jgi:hypothetical protein